MKSTGKINPISGEEILQAEASDVYLFIYKNWEDLTDNEKVTFLSFRGYGFLSKMNELIVKADYERHQINYSFRRP